MNYTKPIETLLSKLPGAKQSGNGWIACCPAHEDRTPSLSITEGDDGRVLIKCHAKCTTAAICAALGLSLSDLFADSPAKRNGKPKTKGATKPAPKIETMPNGNAASRPKGKIVAEYNYRDETGTLLFQAVRMNPKDFRQRRPDGKGGWTWSVKGVRTIPYRLPELLAEPTRSVAVAEGEKDVDGLARIGVLATCNAMGAGKWTTDHAQFLRGRHVLILPDHDDAGRKHAQQVAQTLHGIAASVRVLALPGLSEKGDVSDWLAAGGTRDELVRLAKAASLWEPVAEWPEIMPFEAVSLPEFPTDALPPVLRDYVEALSIDTQTPADMAGLLVLAVVAACIARRVVVEGRPGWREPTNLFVAVLMEPANRKSDVFRRATAPLREIEAERIEAARPEYAREMSDRRQQTMRRQKLEKVAAEKGDDAARHEAGNIAADLELHPEPALPRLIIDDATSEKLGMILAEQGGRIASMSPEGGVFDLMAGLYSKSGIPQFGVYLMGHAGDDLTTDRVSRQSVQVKRPALTCAYAMQPAVIEGLAEQAAFRGRGLLARFLYAAPRSWIGYRDICPAILPEAINAAWWQIVRRLADVAGEHVLQLSDDADFVFECWRSETEAALQEGSDMETIRDWGGKLAGQTLRIAAALHCAEHGGPLGEISRSTIEAAVAIARYLIPHAEHVLSAMQATDGDAAKADADAQYVLRWIERHGKREFTKRDAQQHCKRRFPQAHDIDSPLCVLESRGYIREQKPLSPPAPGRPPSPTYDTNPALFGSKTENENTEKRSQYSHNSEIEAPEGSSENIESASERFENQNRVRVTL